MQVTLLSSKNWYYCRARI